MKHFFSTLYFFGLLCLMPLLSKAQSVITTTVFSTSPINCSFGNATVVASGGQAPYNYQCNGTSNYSGIFYFSNAGTYLVMVYDSIGNADTSSVVIQQGTPGIDSIIAVGQGPCGFNLGSISISAFGGNSPYAYYLNNSTTSSVVNNLPNGTYTVTAVDINGCSLTSIVTLASNSFNASATKDTICIGESSILNANSSLAIIGPAVMPIGYSVSSSNSPLDEEILQFTCGNINSLSSCTSTGGSASNGLPASVQGRYSNYTSAFSGSGASGVAIPFSLKLGYCGSTAYSNTAAIYLDWNRNGVFDLPMEKMWSKPNGTLPIAGQVFSNSFIIPTAASPGKTLMRIVYSESISSQPVGIYSFGETEDYAFTIGSPASGTISWMPASGLSTTTGSTVIATPTITTTYTVITTDTTTCNDTAYVTINVMSGLNYSTITDSVSDSHCTNANNGSITLIETPVTNSLTYAWSNNATTSTINNLAPGIYSVLIKDTANGCLRLIDTVGVNNSNCGSIKGSVIKDANNNCIQDAGEIGINGVLITANPGNFTTNTDNLGSYTFAALPYGTYTITQSPVAGYYIVCGSSKVDSVVSPSIPTVNFFDSVAIPQVALSVVSTTLPINCSLGSISLTVIGGTAPYTFLLNGLTATQSITSISTPGIYTITVVDAYGNSATTLAIVALIAYPLSVDIASFQIPCGTTSGSILLNTTGGTLPMDVTINGVSGALNNTNLSAGTYNFIVTDSMGCTANTFINLSPINLNSIINRDTICPGDTTLLQATAFGVTSGIGSMPLGYSASNATSSLDEEIFNVTLGGFSNTSSCITTGGGASNGLPASILNKYSNYTHLNVPGMAVGTSVPFSVTIGQCSNIAYSGKFSIFIDFDRNGVIDLPAENVFTSTYGSIALAGTTFTGNISIPANASSGATLLRVVFSETNGNINPIGTYTWGETEDYKVIIGHQLQGTTTWFPSNGLNTNTGNAVIASPATTTTYTLVNSDTALCQDTAFVTVHVKNGLNYSTISSVKTDAACPLSFDGSIAIAETPSTNSLSYVWSNNATVASLTNLGLGNYTITIYDTTGGCQVVMDSILSIGYNCGNIGGIVTVDANVNCISDAFEIGIPNVMITANPGGHITFTDALGNYTFTGLPYNTYAITQSIAPGYINNCVSTIIDTLSASALSINANFSDSSYQIYDYWAHTSFWNCLAPALGNNHKFIHFGHNQIGQSTTGTIYAIFDSIAHYGSSLPAHSSINGDTVFWNLSTINMFNSAIDITWALNPALQMGVNIGLQVGIINTQFGDTNTVNNQQSKTFITCTSYDPNDKYVAPEGKTAAGYITKADNELTYDIHFQNTGNATAANVVISDEISNYLDITTFKVLNASHNYAIEVINNQTIKFKFLGIMLVDSGANFEASQGNITYSIKQKNTNIAGDIILNKAYIYFDYNAPIITDNTVNTLYDDIQINSITNTNNAMCNATCGNGSITINATNGVAPLSYNIVPSCANTIISGNVISNLPAGNFVVKTVDAIGNEIPSAVTIAQTPSILNMQSTVTQPTNTAGGSIIANGINGVAPYTYAWLPGNGTTSTMQNLPSGTYTCTITDAMGCYSTATFTMQMPTGIGQYNKTNSISIFPNPASNTLHVESNNPLLQLNIYNAVGQKVMTVSDINTKQTDLNISQLANGIYQIQIGMGEVRKFVISR